MAASRRPAAPTTASLILRGALRAHLGIAHKTVTVAKTDKDGSELLAVVVPKEPSEADLAKVFALANEQIVLGSAIRVYDVPRAACPPAAFEFVAYEPPPAMTKVRVAVIEGWALSAVAHDGSHTSGGLFCAHTRGCAGVEFKKKKYNSNKRELSIYFSCGAAVPAHAATPVQADELPADVDWVALGVAQPAPPTPGDDAATPGAAQSPAGATVTPWEVEGVVDYDKLLVHFGSTKIDDDLLERFRKVTGHEPHHWLKRGIFFSHRDLNLVLDAVEQGEHVYLYTGRGPSSEALHFGHLIPFMFTKWLQDVLKCPLVIQLTDDEKFLWKDLELDEATRLGYENARDIMAVGFDPERTFIFLNTEYMGHMYALVKKIEKKVTFNQVKGIFGFGDSDSIGKIAFPAVQAAPSFSDAFPVVLGRGRNLRCLIPCAIDQDPYFRMTRDVAVRLGLKKPSLVHAKFFPALQGAGSKMSGSVTDSAVMVTDDATAIGTKIKEKAFSGGRDTREQQQALGANLDADIAFQWLNFFLADDAQLAEIARLYGPGELRDGEKRMMTHEVKQVLVDILIDMASTHQRNRAALTEETMNEVFSIRSIVA